LFNIYQLRNTITKYNSNTFNTVHGFCSIVDTNITTYYALDHANQKVVMFNEYWEYQNASFVGFNVANAISVEKELYITGNNYIQKRDKNLNWVTQFYNININFRGIYYNKTNDLIYVGISNIQEIYLFDRNLTKLRTISTPGYATLAIAEFDNKMFVGTEQSRILVIENEIITRNFITNCTSIKSILVDNSGYILILGTPFDYVNVYHTNGTNTGKGIPTSSSQHFINFDSKGRLIMTSQNEINIYY
jgi:hypothetical protein